MPTLTKYSAIKEKGSGYYLERLNDDVNEISTFLGNVAGTLVDVFTNFGFLVIIYFLSPQCGLFFTIGVALLFVIESIKVNVDLKNLELVKKSTEKANSEFNEIIHGMKDIKGFGIKSEINDKMANANEDLLEKVYKKNTKFELISRFSTYKLLVIDEIGRSMDVIKEKFDDVVVIRVNRINFESELTKAQQQHKIENAMNEYKDYDYILTNDTLEKLEEDVLEVLRKEVVVNEKND